MGPPAIQPVAVASVTAGGSSGGGSSGARGSSGGPPPAGAGDTRRSRPVTKKGPFGRPPSRDAQMSSPGRTTHDKVHSPLEPGRSRRSGSVGPMRGRYSIEEALASLA
eukprot:3403460-Karenia_brevis.AAC.1